MFCEVFLRRNALQRKYTEVTEIHCYVHQIKGRKVILVVVTDVEQTPVDRGSLPQKIYFSKYLSKNCIYFVDY